MNFKFSFLSIFLLALIVSSCKQEPDQPYTGAIPGKISGRVRLIPPFGLTLDDYSGVTFTLEPAGYSTQSDKDGVFIFENINPGTYNLAYSKAGFGYKKFYNLTYTGGPSTYFFEYPSGFGLCKAMPGVLTTPVITKIDTFFDNTIRYYLKFRYVNPDLDTTIGVFNELYPTLYLGKNPSVSVLEHDTAIGYFVGAVKKDDFYDLEVTLPVSSHAREAKYVWISLGIGNFMTDPFGVRAYGGGLLEAPEVLVLP